MRYFIIFALLSVFSLPLFAQEGAIENLRQTGKAFASVAKTVSPAVVLIQVEGKKSGENQPAFNSPFGDNNPFGDDFLRRFFGDSIPRDQNPQRQAPPQQEFSAQGSGFVFKTDSGILKDKAFILTNNHVVQDADKIRVKFNDGREFDAKVTGRDPLSDVAVVEISEDKVPTVKLGESSKLEVGEWVVAIGNPFGLSHTLTVGVVSATGRTAVGINDYEDFIQTDAAINPGNSGGPLVNLSGEVIGINTAIFSRSGGYMGIGFAIPIDMAKKIADQLIDKGEVTRGFLGIVIQPLTPELAESFGIAKDSGILVAEVSKDSAGDKAGLKQGDVIIDFKGKKVSEVGEFRNRVSLTPPGEKAEMTILRNGEHKKLNVVIGKREGSKLASEGEGHTDVELGITVSDNDDGEGIVVNNVKPGSIASRGGIKPGDVILQADRKTIKSATEFKKIVEKASSEKRILLLVKSNNSQHFLVLKW